MLALSGEIQQVAARELALQAELINARLSASVGMDQTVDFCRVRDPLLSSMISASLSAGPDVVPRAVGTGCLHSDECIAIVFDHYGVCSVSTARAHTSTSSS
jgi:hypothetical protein